MKGIYRPTEEILRKYLNKKEEKESRKKISKILNISENFLSSVIHDKRYLSQKKLDKLIEVLEINDSQDIIDLVLTNSYKKTPLTIKAELLEYYYRSLKLEEKIKEIKKASKIDTFTLRRFPPSLK